MASPNLLIVALADDLLGRDGRTRAAVEAIGRVDYEEGGNAPFRLALDAL